MTSITERTIFEQFEYLDRALGRSRSAPSSGTVVFVGCGTSYNLALSLAASANARGIRSLAAPGHEWARRPEAYMSKPTDAQVVCVSRSGESTEIVEAAKASRASGVTVTVITCEPRSSLARIADVLLSAVTHPDEGIVMTSSASLMLSIGLQYIGTEVTKADIAMAKKLLMSLEGDRCRFFDGRSHFIYLGGGPLYGIAAEGALKLQEMSCTVTQCYHPLEYRHGPISVLDDKSVVVVLYHPHTRGEEERLVREISARGAFVVGLGGQGDLELRADASADVLGLVYLPALQLLGERLAGVRKLDTDAPRNLTKVIRIA